MQGLHKPRRTSGATIAIGSLARVGTSGGKQSDGVKSGNVAKGVKQNDDVKSGNVVNDGNAENGKSENAVNDGNAENAKNESAGSGKRDAANYATKRTTLHAIATITTSMALVDMRRIVKVNLGS